MQDSRRRDVMDFVTQQATYRCETPWCSRRGQPVFGQPPVHGAPEHETCRCVGCGVWMGCTLSEAAGNLRIALLEKGARDTASA